MTTWTKLVAALVVVGLAACLYAQGGDKAPARMPGAFGKVVKVDGKTLTINGKLKKDDEAKDLAFTITDETKITIGQGKGVEPKAGTVADLTEGKNVFVMYKAGEGDQKTALTISIRPEGAGPKAPKVGG